MLDARKLARIMGNRARMRQGRTRTVTLVYRRPERSVYVAADVVWRAQPYAEPPAASIGAAGAAGGAGMEPAAVRAEFPPQIDPRLVTFIADTPVATAEAATSAPRYVVARYHPGGIVTDRWVVELKRLR